jgi:MYXO-CTERM domain-containing protein
MAMKMRLIAGAFLLTTWFQAGASADLIFDNTATAQQGMVTTTAPLLGVEVTAAGTARFVNELDIGFTSGGVAATANLQAFLFANDGAGGAPGTLLWQSAVMTGVSLNTLNELIAFSVPSVLVPDTFTWASAITDVTPGVTVGYVPASGASTGTFDGTWVGNIASWGSLGARLETEGRVIASAVPIPEPSTFFVAGIAGLTGLVGAWVRRRRAA